MALPNVFGEDEQTTYSEVVTQNYSNFTSDFQTAPCFPTCPPFSEKTVERKDDNCLTVHTHSGRA